MDLNYLLLMIVGIAMTGFAQFMVSSRFKKYSKVRSIKGYKGHQVARIMLDHHNMSHVNINSARGHLTDHYNPRNKSVNLSQSVGNSSSLAAIAVAAHEVGHAIQDNEDYGFLRFRHMMVPIVNFTSRFVWILIFIGFLINMAELIDIGIIFFSLTVLFQIVTLPVELNASKRALVNLENLNLIERSEKKGARKVLSAAALTYLAAMIYSILNLIRLLGMRED